MKTVLRRGLALVPAEADDLGYVSACIRESVVASVPSGEASLSDLWADTAVAVALDSLSNRKMGDEVFILKDGDVRKGMLWMGVSRDQYNAEPVGYVLGIYVDPDLRRKGIGRELMGCAESWCSDHDLMELQLNVGSCNAAAIAMYESAGFGSRSSTLCKPLKRADRL